MYANKLLKATFLLGLCAALGLASLPVAALENADAQSGLTNLVHIDDPLVPLAGGSPVIRSVSAPGVLVEQNDRASIDFSNASEGYVMVKYKGNNSNAKLQLTGTNAITYTYNLSGGGYESFPLTSGSGSYTANVYENVSGSSYALALRKTFNAQITNPLSPYLYPNQYVNYNASSQTVAMGAQLAAGAANEMQVVENIYNWVISNISYDDQKAATVRSGYLPVVDSIIASGKGICFDYTAVMAAMLRTQNIPTRMEVGYISTGTYHAWISVYLQESGWVNGIIQFDGNTWKLMDPTLASSNSSNAGAMAFINNTGNYKKSYVY